MPWLREVIPYVAPVVVVAAMARASWVAVRVLARPGPMRVCGCGYALRGLPEPVCPECGARHEDSARARAVRRRRLAVLVWSAACGLAGVCGLQVAGMTAPIRSDTNGWVLFTYPGAEGGRCDLLVDWGASGSEREERVTGVKVSYARGKRQAELAFGPGDGGRVGPELRRVLGELGTPYADHAETFPEAAAAVVRGIMAEPTARLTSDLRSNSIGTGSTTRRVAEPRRAGVLLVLGLAWGAGVRGLARRR